MKHEMSADQHVEFLQQRLIQSTGPHRCVCGHLIWLHALIDETYKALFAATKAFGIAITMRTALKVAHGTLNNRTAANVRRYTLAIIAAATEKKNEIIL